MRIVSLIKVNEVGGVNKMKNWHFLFRGKAISQWINEIH